MSTSQLGRRLTSWTSKPVGERRSPSFTDVTDNNAAKSGSISGPGSKREGYQWDSTLTYLKYSTLLKLKHPHIIEIDGGEWPHFLDSDLSLPCTLRVTKPPEPRIISVYDLIMSVPLL